MKYRSRTFRLGLIAGLGLLGTACSVAAQAEDRTPTFGTAPAQSKSDDEWPDYISVVDSSGTIVGYIDKRFIITSPLPESPGDAAATKEVVFPVVNKSLELVAYVGSQGLLTADDVKALQLDVADISDYGTPLPRTEGP